MDHLFIKFDVAIWPVAIPWVWYRNVLNHHGCKTSLPQAILMVVVFIDFILKKFM